LAGDQIASVVQGTAGVAVTRCAAVWVIRKSIGFRATLITVPSGHISLASTLTGVHIASGVIDGSQDVASTSFATLQVLLGEVPESFATLVATTSFYVYFAVTSTALDVVFWV
jgi:hypothetical protein